VQIFHEELERGKAAAQKEKLGKKKTINWQGKSKSLEN